MKKIFLSMVLLTAATAIGSVVRPVHAVVIDDQSAAQKQTEIQKKLDEKRSEIEQKQREITAEKQKKLEEVKRETKVKQAQAKQKICERIREKTKARHEHIKTVAEQIASRIDKRVENAKNFVTEKNLTIISYDSLLADVKAKKQAVETARSEIIAAVGSFDCGSDNAKVQQAIVRQKVEAYKVAVKAYRESVKSLLQAVKTAAQAQLQSESVSQNSSDNGR